MECYGALRGVATKVQQELSAFKESHLEVLCILIVIDVDKLRGSRADDLFQLDLFV